MSTENIKITRAVPAADQAWIEALSAAMREGQRTAPRGRATIELLSRQHTVIDMTRCVVTRRSRKLNYAFMAAEALWILSGDNRVESIAPYNKHIAQFSDDGAIFNGAYGPPFIEQLPYVVSALYKDRDTRQAVMTLWRPSPQPSRDIPCTTALAFSIRGSKLHLHVFMRSSDLWLGLPYDVFNFSMMAACIACELNTMIRDHQAGDCVQLGQLTVSAVSSHLYEPDIEKAHGVLSDGIASWETDGVWLPLPQAWITGGAWDKVISVLVRARDNAEPPYGEAAWRVRPERVS